MPKNKFTMQQKEIIKTITSLFKDDWKNRRIHNETFRMNVDK